MISKYNVQEINNTSSDFEKSKQVQEDNNNNNLNDNQTNISENMNVESIEKIQKKKLRKSTRKVA